MIKLQNRIFFEEISNAQVMVVNIVIFLWHGRPNGCGSWLPEDKNDKCAMEEENVVSYGRLPSPARLTVRTIKI